MSPLRFHAQTFDLLGLEPRRSAAAVGLLEERQQRLAVRFPESFVEWYEQESALELLGETFDPGDLESNDWSAEVVTGGVLYLPGCDTQAGAHFVQLDGTQDPPVRARELDSEETVAGSKLSDFIFDVMESARRPAVDVAVTRPPPREEELAWLAGALKPRPVVRRGSAVTYRFHEGDRRLTIRHDGGTSWEVGAAARDGLLELLVRLVDRGIFAPEALREERELLFPCSSCQAVVHAFAPRCQWCGAPSPAFSAAPRSRP